MLGGLKFSSRVRGCSSPTDWVLRDRRQKLSYFVIAVPQAYLFIVMVYTDGFF